MNIKTLCLGILSFGDASGYEIKKQLEGPFRHFYDASFGSIYPALGKLTEESLVECTELTQRGRPDKKVYHITPGGRLELVQQLHEPPSRDRIRSDFLVTMLFAELLPAAHVDELVGHRIEDYRSSLDELYCSRENDSASADFVRGFGCAVYAAALRYLEENRHRIVGESLRAQAEVAE